MYESEKSKWSRSVVSDSSRPHGLQPTRPLRPWDFPGKSTGVGCHCLLHIIQCSKLVFSTLVTVNCWILIRCILISSIQKFWYGWIDQDFGYFVFVLQGTVFLKIVIELLGPTKMFCSSRKYFFCQTLRVLIVPELPPVAALPWCSPLKSWPGAWDLGEGLED